MMKKYLLSLALICVWLLAACLSLTQNACADAPQEVLLNYNIKAQTLTVTVTHKSSFTGIHYIKQIEIKKNNEPAEKKVYSTQPGKKAFTYTYNIPAAVNDVLEVTVACNIQGQKTATLKVEQEKN